MKARRQRQDVRAFTNGHQSEGDFHHLNGEIPTPTAGLSTPRRIVKSLKAPPTCVTQLVQLDSNQPHQSRRFSSIAMSVPSDCSVSEVRSELCSMAIEEQGEVSMSSMFDHRRMRQARRASMGRVDTRKANKQPPASRSTGARTRQHRRSSSATRGAAASPTTGGGREVEESTILSYSDTGSFYSYDSMEHSTNSHSVRSGSSESCRSISYTAISESVPSCSLTIMGDTVPRIPVASGWGGRGRRNLAARKHSGSFGSLFGGGIDPYDGTSISSNPAPGSSTHNVKHSSQAASLSTATNSVAQVPPSSSAASMVKRDGPLRKPSTDSQADFGSTVDFTMGAPPLSKPTTGEQIAAASSSDDSCSRSPRDLDTTQRDAHGAEGGRSESEIKAAHSKRKVVTVSGVSPKKKARRSSLFGPESPNGAATAASATEAHKSTAAGSSTLAEGDASGGPHSPMGSSGKDGGAVDGSNDGPPQRVFHTKREERIGRGSYGDVYRGVDLDTGATIAIKEIIVPKDFTRDLDKQLTTLEREIRVMRKLQHPNIIHYIGAVRDDNSLSIIMEFISGGTVGELLRAEGALSEERTRGYAAQLLNGLEYLHQRHIVHRDLKGDNLFLADNDVLKLGDFGTSKELVTTLVTDSVAGTPNFMAPEVIACSGHSYAADIWSVGCCVLEMLTGLPPFAKLDNHMAVMFAVMKGKLEEQVPAEISGGAKEFIKLCTMHDPKDRWTVSQLRQHPWLLGESVVTVSDDGAAIATTGTAAGEFGQGTTAAAREQVLPHEERKKPSGRSPRGRAKDRRPSPSLRRKTSGAAAPSMPPIPSPAGNRKTKSAAPLEPAALARTSASHGGGTHLPAPKRSPLPPHSEDGEIGGTTSSDPSSNGNSPGSRTKAGKGGKRSSSSKKAVDTPMAGGAEGPLEVEPPARMAATARSSSGRPPTKPGSAAPSRTHSGATRGAAALAPQRPATRSSSAAASGGRRRRSNDDSKTQNISGDGTASNDGGSPTVIASPPAGSPTNNPRRSKLSGNRKGSGNTRSMGSALALTPNNTSNNSANATGALLSPPREKKKKTKLSI